MTYPFTIYHKYTDGSGTPTMIYIGADKTAAFDALWSFIKNEFAYGGELYMYTAPTIFMENKSGKKS